MKNILRIEFSYPQAANAAILQRRLGELGLKEVTFPSDLQRKIYIDILLPDANDFVKRGQIRDLLCDVHGWSCCGPFCGDLPSVDFHGAMVATSGTSRMDPPQWRCLQPGCGATKSRDDKFITINEFSQEIVAYRPAPRTSTPNEISLRSRPIQGTASDMAKKELRQAAKHISFTGNPIGPMFVTTTHDEMFFELPEEKVEEAVERWRRFLNLYSPDERKVMKSIAYAYAYGAITEERIRALYPDVPGHLLFKARMFLDGLSGHLGMNAAIATLAKSKDDDESVGRIQKEMTRLRTRASELEKTVESFQQSNSELREERVNLLKAEVVHEKVVRAYFHLEKTADKAFRFMAGLSTQDYPVSVQREYVEITRQLGAALRELNPNKGGKD